MLGIRNVLVATDFSDCSKAALDCGRAIADAFGARLHLLHAVPPVSAGGPDGVGFIGELIDQQTALGEAERHGLESLLTAEDKAQLRACAVLRLLETPADAIVDYARAEHVDVIVVGTHGRRGLSHWVLGSVAEQVIRLAPCPVLTVRPQTSAAKVDAA